MDFEKKSEEASEQPAAKREIDPVEAREIYEKTKEALPVYAIGLGIQAGVLQEELALVARKGVEVASREGRHLMAITMAENLRAIGNFTDEEIAELKQAEEEARRAAVVSEEELLRLRAETPKKLEINETTTFAKLFAEILRLESIFGRTALQFEEELYAVLGQEAADELMLYMTGNETQQGSINVLEFFQRHGHSFDEIRIFKEE